MNIQLAAWDPPMPQRRRRWIPRCQDCGRRVWAPSSLSRRWGRILGGGCYRKRVRASRRLTIPVHIVVRAPGHIPGQTEINTTEESA